MKNKINNFLLNHNLNQEDASLFLSEYCRQINKREIRPDELQILLTQLSGMIDWDKLVNIIAKYNDITIYRLYNKQGRLIKQWIP